MPFAPYLRGFPKASAGMEIVRDELDQLGL